MLFFTLALPKRCLLPYLRPISITQIYRLLLLITGCIQSWKTWKTHEIPFFFSRHGKVMEIDSRFWKIHKKSWKLKGILFRNGIISFIQHFNTMIHYVIRSNFGVFHIFLYCDWNLVHGSRRQNRWELVASVGAHGLGTRLFHATKHVKGP